jgi:hypothetical protein
MKKQLLILATALLSISTFAQIPTYVPANGLVGWWPFNGNANDESGNGNHGTVNGATLTQDRFGNANMAYGFDGVDDKITAGNYNITSDFSISFWCNLQTSNFQYPIGLGININNTVDLYKGFGIGYSSTNPPCNGLGNSKYFIYDAVSTCNSWIEMNNTTPINTWTYITATRNNNLISLYKNGVLDVSSSSLNLPGILNLYFGSRSDDFAFYQGSLDDIGIWNRALTACEIQDLYHAQLGSQAISAGADQSICSGDNVTLSGAGGSNYQWNNNVVDGQAFTPNQSANYVLNGTDSLGCQGTDTVVVTVLENATSTLTQTALDSYTLNGQTYTQSGTYTQTVPAANGCDSNITLNLTLNFTGMDELGTGAKKLVKITDLNGKIIPRRKNTLMLFIYEDGTVERVVEIQE